METLILTLTLIALAGIIDSNNNNISEMNKMIEENK